MQLIPDVRFTLQIMVATAPQKSSAKARILQASILLFARMPFSETSLRDIAAEAKVDVVYVHRAFGSKSEIFRQALEATAALDEVFTPDGNPAGLIDRITERAFLRDPQCIRDVEPLHLVLQSSSCSEARSILNDFVTTSIARPLADAFGQKDIGRAMFAVSILNGFITMRTVLGNPGLLAMSKEDLKAMLTRALFNAMLT